MKKIMALIALLFLVGCAPIEYPDRLVNSVSARTDLPITTWEDAFALAVEKFGSEEIWECRGENMTGMPPYDWVGEFPLDEFNNYGHQSTTLIDGQKEIVGYKILFECNLVKEWDWFGECAVDDDCGAWQDCYDGICRRKTMSHVGLDFEFDPNNGWIGVLFCNQKYYSDCPMDDGEYVYIRQRSKDNPDYEDYLELLP